jgi:predicted Rossmann-fold nucleotide-binding protein
MKLYSPADLFGGFETEQPGSYANTFDATTYLETRVDHSTQAGARRALHDHDITVARDAFIASHRSAGKPVVAMMGGHAEQRGSEVYVAVAKMAHELANHFLVASGGGPGAMEATHLGALISDSTILDEAIEVLQRSAAFPEGMKHLVDGESLNQAALARLHPWQVPAFEVLASIPESQRRESLAIPTWFYGHEPPTPFATHLAKYFHNALREDGLLAIADAGIIYAPGKAGTLQEIFQDAAQNYYESFGRFSPMAFLDIAGYWSEYFPVEKILRPLFGDEKYDRWVLISPDADEVAGFIQAHH